MRPRIEDVHKAAIAYYPNLERGWLTSPARARKIAWPRQVAMTVTRRITGKSLPQIGLAFGGRDHSTAIHAIRAVTLRLDSHPETRTALEAIEALAYRRAEHRLSGIR